MRNKKPTKKKGNDMPFANYTDATEEKKNKKTRKSSTTDVTVVDKKVKPVKKSEPKLFHIGARLTHNEHLALQRVATRRKMTMSDLLRDVLAPHLGKKK